MHQLLLVSASVRVTEIMVHAAVELGKRVCGLGCCAGDSAVVGQQYASMRANIACCSGARQAGEPTVSRRLVVVGLL
jgi:hypothetical protein